MSMYGMSEGDLNKIDKQTPSLPFPVASNVSNVKLVDCKVEELGTTGIQAIKLYWTRNEGGVQHLTQSIIELNKDSIYERASANNKDPKEALETETIRFKAKLKHILECFGYDKAEISAGFDGVDSFQGTGETLAQMILARKEDHSFYCKTVRNKKGYVEIAAFPPFLQNMSGGECSLRYSKYELDMNQRNNSPSVSVSQEVEGVAGGNWQDSL